MCPCRISDSVVAQPSSCSRWCAGIRRAAPGVWLLPTTLQEAFTRGAYRFFDHEGVTRTALHAPMQARLREQVSPSQTACVAHDVSVLNYTGHQRKEDLIPVGNDHTFGYELFSDPRHCRGFSRRCSGY